MEIKREKIFLFIFIVSLCGYGYYYKFYRTKKIKTHTKKIVTTQVKKGRIALVVDTTGKVVSNLDVEIKCKASGQINMIPFDVSDRVKKGDLILKLDPIDEQRRVKQAEVALSASLAKYTQEKQNYVIEQKKLEIELKRAYETLKSAKARAKEADQKVKRQQKASQKDLASQNEYETFKYSSIQAQTDLENAKLHIDDLKIKRLSVELKQQDIKLAQTQVKLKEIELSIARQRLSDTKVFSPIDGVISSKNVQIGQIISSGISNVGGGTSALVLSDLSKIFIIASVDESDIGKVQVGQKANVTTDAFPGRRFRGKVVRIATKGENISSVVTFEVKIEIYGKSKALLKPEMTANIKIIIAEKDDTLLVPSEVVHTNYHEEKQQYLFVLLGKKQEKREITTGITNGIQTEILKGVTLQDTIIIKKKKPQADGKREGVL